ncbi:recombinase family protein [Azospirillum argentinense]
MAKIGYARVSTVAQELERQRIALRQAGCVEIVEEAISSDPTRRRRAEDRATKVPPKLAALLARLELGDTLVVDDLDRFSRDGAGLTCTLIDDLKERGVGVQIVSLGLNTLDEGAEMVVAVVAVLARQERDKIRRRTVAGLEAARSKGVTLGRKRVMTPEKIEYAMAVVRANPMKTVREVAAIVGVSVGSLYNAVPELKTVAMGAAAA